MTNTKLEENFWKLIGSSEIELCDDRNFFNNLEYVEPLGIGSFGNVHLYQHKGKFYAKKIIKRENVFGNTQKAQLLRDELINHFAISLNKCPYVCNIVCLGKEKNGDPAIVQEFCGMNLKVMLLEEHQSLRIINISDKIRWVHQLLEGLVCIHKLSIVHLDIKPDNLLIDNIGNLKIIDFGLSLHASILHKKHPVRGTRGYIAPETESAGLLSDKNDSFSVGKTVEQIFINNSNTPKKIKELIQHFVIIKPQLRWSIETGLSFLDGTMISAKSKLIDLAEFDLLYEKFRKQYEGGFYQSVQIKDQLALNDTMQELLRMYGNQNPKLSDEVINKCQKIVEKIYLIEDYPQLFVGT